MRGEPHLHVVSGGRPEDAPARAVGSPEELERLERVVAVGLLVEEIALRLGTTLDKALRRLLLLSAHERYPEDEPD